uniref:Uncharacterized protein n=1 Tax=Arundo donax TaxID=35708 RepID=A0A0A8Z2J3_ARUDO
MQNLAIPNFLFHLRSEHL